MATLAPLDTILLAHREQMILRYRPLVRHAVRALRPVQGAVLDADDLVSYGTMGLIDAVDRFDASRGVKFETYAAARIRGYLLDQLRALDWLPRSARAQARAVERVEAHLGHRPSHAELAAATGLPPEVCERALAAGAGRIVSLDHLRDGADEPGPIPQARRLVDEQSPNPATTTEEAELRLALTAALAGLPAREREVLYLRYVRSWTLRAIARRLAISESRASQLQAQGLARMRRALGEQDVPDQNPRAAAGVARRSARSGARTRASRPERSA